jgi:GDP/GTP exchange factor Sec2p
VTDLLDSVVDKLADYEDEIQKLKIAQASQQMPPPQTPRDITPSPTPSEETQQPPPSRGSGVISTSTSRLSSFLTSRKSSPALASEAVGHPSPSLPTTEELQKVLSSEKEKRRKAETQLDQANGELEELSASLFMQANEMVAEERRARAKLEERVAVLEKRDGDKRARLEKLEKAVDRINRVRGLLAP